jgi:hypothetical protein
MSEQKERKCGQKYCNNPVDLDISYLFCLGCVAAAKEQTASKNNAVIRKVDAIKRVVN